MVAPALIATGGRDGGSAPRESRRRTAVASMAAAVALVLSGCWPWSAPTQEPATPEPVSTSASPLGPDALAAAGERCGTAEAAPEGSFATEASRSPWVLPNGMTLQVGLTVPLESEHGKHTVRLADTHGSVVDGEGLVVGTLTGLTAPSGSSGPGTAYSAAVVLSLGACPDGGAALGDALGDGEYQLVLWGPVSPYDHDHATQEYWVAPGLAVGVADGEILPA